MAFVAGVVVVVVAVGFVVSAVVAGSVSLGFLFGTSFSPLDSDSDRLVAAAESSVVAASGAAKEIKYFE